MKITWFGTATVGLESEKSSIMFDPYIQMPGGEHPIDKDVFAKPKNVFITHGHVDHLSSVPELIATTDIMVYCGQVAATTLIKQGVSMKQIRTIHYGDVIPTGNINVRALKGKHVSFGPWLVFKTMVNPRMITYSQNLVQLAKMHKKYREGDNTFVYEIKAEGMRILLLGSLALDERTEYPQDIDVLVLPYQGSSSLQRKAIKIIRRVRPKTVILSHFDDAFPPISRSINTRKFQLTMSKRMPFVKVIRPEVGIPIVVEKADENKKTDENKKPLAIEEK